MVSLFIFIYNNLHVKHIMLLLVFSSSKSCCVMHNKRPILYFYTQATVL